MLPQATSRLREQSYFLSFVPSPHWRKAPKRPGETLLRRAGRYPYLRAIDLSAGNTECEKNPTETCWYQSSERESCEEKVLIPYHRAQLQVVDAWTRSWPST